MFTTPVALYVASVLGAVALCMMMPAARRRVGVDLGGRLLAAATLGGLWLFLAGFFGQPSADGSVWHNLGGLSEIAFSFQYIFSFIAIAAAVRVIIHTRPVFATLWFVLVVLASAGLFITLNAEFMALAMILIYAGAILVTYMFVIMLAAQGTPDDKPENQQVYDRVSRDPIIACGLGFLLLAVLLSVAFEPMAPNPTAAGPTNEQITSEILPRRSQERVAGMLEAQQHLTPAAQEARLREITRVTNAERVGIDLFRNHPLGLELAGVILLVALIGAVVMARKHVYEEDEVIDRLPQAGRGPRKD